ncbi:beta-lactamase/transpeptidase-like protein [Trichoderma compactum]
MAQIQGHLDPKFEELRNLFQKNLDSKAEVGASISLNIDGKDVVDIWGGFADEECTQPWESDAIVGVWSSTKGLASLALLMLIDRGLVDADAKVAKYWPEFAADGKKDIEIRHIMSHTSGLSAWEEKVTWDDVCDQDHAAAKLAAQAPLWEPGTASAYHIITFGPFKQFVAEEIAAPLKADFQIGLLDKDIPRVSNIIPHKDTPPPREAPEAGSVAFKTFTNPALDANMLRSETIRKADLSSFNGFTNARAMNRIFSVLALGGEVNGVRLLSQKTIELIFREQSNGTCLATGQVLRWGIGGSGLVNFMPTGRIGVWGGWGGSLFVFDADRKLTFTYAMNQMSNRIMADGREGDYLTAVYKALGVAI